MPPFLWWWWGQWGGLGGVEIWSHYVVLAGLRLALVIPLPLLPVCYDYMPWATMKLFCLFFVLWSEFICVCVGGGQTGLVLQPRLPLDLCFPASAFPVLGRQAGTPHLSPCMPLLITSGSMAPSGKL